MKPESENHQKNKEKNHLGLQTLMTHEMENNPHGSVVPPIFQNTLFTFDSYQDMKEGIAAGTRYYYSRVSNPTVEIAEKKMAAMEHGEAAKIFSSGMAAITCTLFHFLKQGDHIICGYPLYGGTYELLEKYMPRYGIEVDFVDMRDLTRVYSLIRPNTKVLYCESQTTFFFDVLDLPELVRISKEHNLITIIDNTCATPYNLNPLTMGFDVVIHSASKYLSGHSDITAGVVVSSNEIIKVMNESEAVLFGASLSPLEAWLFIRGLRTFGIRMEQHAKSALKIARFLQNHSKVKRVNFPFCRNMNSIY